MRHNDQYNTVPSSTEVKCSSGGNFHKPCYTIKIDKAV